MPYYFINQWLKVLWNGFYLSSTLNTIYIVITGFSVFCFQVSDDYKAPPPPPVLEGFHQRIRTRVGGSKSPEATATECSAANMFSVWLSFALILHDCKQCKHIFRISTTQEKYADEYLPHLDIYKKLRILCHLGKNGH